MLSEATAALDPRSHAAVVKSVTELRKDAGLIWSLQRATDCENFDIVVVVENGRVTHTGSYAELCERSDRFKQMLAPS